MKTTKTILITGGNGQLGQCFKQVSKLYTTLQFLFVSKEELDIANEKQIDLYFTNNKIDVCINCAAYTAVDKAEQEKELATLVNTTAVGYLAKACKLHNAHFIHISTDYVFDGKTNTAYKPNDITNPINFYGKTKLHGEQLAIQENPNTIIIRTAWVYSKYGNNFVKTMMRLMNERESIGVVNDQYGVPTFAEDLAAAILQIVTSNNFVSGIYHYSNKGNISWHEFAEEIASIIKTNCVVNEITTNQFPTPAARPSFSILDTSTIENIFGIKIIDWKISLAKCIKQLQG